jgi:predicted CoA-binding protein/uncharacterized protein YndB with AHSA1/START domain
VGRDGCDAELREMNHSPREILEYASTVAVVGLSRDPGKPSGHIPYLLQHRGIRIIPVNPNAAEILGERSYRSLLDIEGPVDVVDVFRPAADAPAIARQAVAIGARALWLQLGIRSDEARSIAEAGGLDYVQDLCMGRQSIQLGIAKAPKIRLVAMSGSITTFTMPSDLEIVATRVFDAPRELVFKAYTTPSLLQRWYGSADTNVIVDRMDLKPRGSWRVIDRGAGEADHAFSGVYLDVEPPSRLAYTFNYEPLPGNHEAVATVTFEEVDGQTRLVTSTRYLTVEDRDGMVKSGMEQGTAESMDRLAELLRRLQSG